MYKTFYSSNQAVMKTTTVTEQKMFLDRHVGQAYILTQYVPAMGVPWVDDSQQGDMSSDPLLFGGRHFYTVH